ncbi:MAG TPA: hypothetical protein QGH16_02760 [Verrucomicrobiota bacterium]|jgi:hypothetical protein|nr:hypothetical protein [Verrucomicrobiota bacterium]
MNHVQQPYVTRFEQGEIYLIGEECGHALVTVNVFKIDVKAETFFNQNKNKKREVFRGVKKKKTGFAISNREQA